MNTPSTPGRLYRNRWLLAALAALTVVALALAWRAAAEPMDFRVYHYGANGVFDGVRPVYGETSGLGWPMHYRYPPLFLLLFAPFAALPLGLAAALWLLSKAALLAVLAPAIARRVVEKSGPSQWWLQWQVQWWIPCLLLAPYIVEELRYGNAQFFVVALAVSGLLQASRRPRLAAACLALGAAVKVWPLFFLPYLAVRNQWKVAAWTVCLLVPLLLLPAVYFGFGGNLDLLAQWTAQEFGTQLGDSEGWFPSQSLRGVLMRYLTEVDYSQVPDSNYRPVHLAAWDAATVRSIWLAAAAAIYLAFLALAYRRRAAAEDWTGAGLAFCLLALLQPFTQKYALSMLLLPAIVAGSGALPRPSRILVYAALTLSVLQPLIPGADAQRLLQVLGVDFAVVSLLAAALVVNIGKRDGA